MSKFRRLNPSLLLRGQTLMQMKCPVLKKSKKQPVNIKLKNYYCLLCHHKHLIADSKEKITMRKPITESDRSHRAQLVLEYLMDHPAVPHSKLPKSLEKGTWVIVTNKEIATAINMSCGAVLDSLEYLKKHGDIVRAIAGFPQRRYISPC